MFYEAFWLVLGASTLSTLAGLIWFAYRNKEELRLPQHEQALSLLAKERRLLHKNASTFTVEGVTGSHLWVSPSGLCILWLKAASKSEQTEAKGALNVPTAVTGWLTCWVDPKHWDKPLPAMLVLRDALAGEGEWAQVAMAHNLQLTQTPAGLPRLEGRIHGRSLQIEATGEGLWVRTQTDPSLRAIPGRGDSGNPVLDLCMDTHGVPEALITPLLELLHQQGGRCSEGALETSWTGGVEELFERLPPIMAHESAQS
jgi:hypothetical protein